MKKKLQKFHNQRSFVFKLQSFANDQNILPSWPYSMPFFFFVSEGNAAPGLGHFWRSVFFHSLIAQYAGVFPLVLRPLVLRVNSPTALCFTSYYYFEYSSYKNYFINLRFYMDCHEVLGYSLAKT